MNPKIDLSEFFITKNQANEFLQSINKVIDGLYEVNFKLENVLSEELGIDKKDKFLAFLRENKMSNSSQENLKDFLEKLQQTIREIPVVNLNIAFEPNQETLKSILQWFSFSLNKQVILDIKVERALIAGATINYNGKFKDYSVKLIFNKITEQSLNHKNVGTQNQPQTVLKQSVEFMSVGR